MDNSKCSQCGGGYDSFQTFPRVAGFGREVNEEYTRRRKSGRFDLCDHCLVRIILAERDRAAAESASPESDEPVSE